METHVGQASVDAIVRVFLEVFWDRAGVRLIRIVERVGRGLCITDYLEVIV